MKITTLMDILAEQSAKTKVLDGAALTRKEDANQTWLHLEKGDVTKSDILRTNKNEDLISNEDIERALFALKGALMEFNYMASNDAKLAKYAEDAAKRFFETGDIKTSL